MLLQAIDFLSLFSLFISGVLMVPKGPDHDRSRGGSEAELWEATTIDHACAVYTVQHALSFLLAVARAVSKWYFNFLPFQTFLTMLLNLTAGN
jgi:hypothetical protein